MKIGAVVGKNIHLRSFMVREQEDGAAASREQEAKSRFVG